MQDCENNINDESSSDTSEDIILDKNNIIINEDVKKFLEKLKAISSEDIEINLLLLLKYELEDCIFTFFNYESREVYTEDNMQGIVKVLPEIIEIMIELNLELIMIITSYVIESGIKIKNNIDFRNLLLDKFLENVFTIKENHEEGGIKKCYYYLTGYNNISITCDDKEITVTDSKSIDDFHSETCTRFEFYKIYPEDQSNIIESDLAKVYYKIFKSIIDDYETLNRYHKTKSARK